MGDISKKNTFEGVGTWDKSKDKLIDIISSDGDERMVLIEFFWNTYKVACQDFSKNTTDIFSVNTEAEARKIAITFLNVHESEVDCDTR